MIIETIYVISVLLSYESGAEFQYDTLEQYDSLPRCERAMEQTDKALEEKVGKNDGRGTLKGYTISCTPKEKQLDSDS